MQNLMKPAVDQMPCVEKNTKRERNEKVEQWRDVYLSRDCPMPDGMKKKGDNWRRTASFFLVSAFRAKKIVTS